MATTTCRAIIETTTIQEMRLKNKLLHSIAHLHISTTKMPATSITGIADQTMPLQEGKITSTAMTTWQSAAMFTNRVVPAIPWRTTSIKMWLSMFLQVKSTMVTLYRLINHLTILCWATIMITARTTLSIRGAQILDIISWSSSMCPPLNPDSRIRIRMPWWDKTKDRPIRTAKDSAWLAMAANQPQEILKIELIASNHIWILRVRLNWASSLQIRLAPTTKTIRRKRHSKREMHLLPKATLAQPRNRLLSNLRSTTFSKQKVQQVNNQ